MSTISPADGPLSRGFAPGAREDFRAAIARHRRNAWLVTAACAVIHAALGLVLAVLLAPLLLCLFVLALDVVNLLVPTPDLLPLAADLHRPSVDAGQLPLPVGLLVRTALLAALPGLALFALVEAALRRALMQAPMFAADPASGHASGRPPDPRRLAEVQIANTVEEMAVAAVIAPPRVVFVPGSVNAAAFGAESGQATVMIGALLPGLLSRAQMQAVAAHLVAGIANGDMAAGLRIAVVQGVFTLFAKLSTAWNNRPVYLAMRRVLAALLTPTPANLRFVLDALSDPLADAAAASPPRDPDRRLTWQEWLQMPLAGPVFFAGLVAAYVRIFLTPLVVLAWRLRKYGEDATAVQLTRDPDALDGALAAIAHAGASSCLPTWAGHLCVVDPGTGRRGVPGDSWPVSIFPAPERRHRALVRMGAAYRSGLAAERPAPSSMPRFERIARLAVAVPLLAVAAYLTAWMPVLIAMASLAITGVFTIVPTIALHVLLRGGRFFL
jgi:Zn-dependent protease with chaperone function